MDFFNKVFNILNNNDQDNELLNNKLEDDKITNSTTSNTDEIENVSKVNNFKQKNTDMPLIDQNIPEVLFLKKLLTEKNENFYLNDGLYSRLYIPSSAIFRESILDVWLHDISTLLNKPINLSYGYDAHIFFHVIYDFKNDIYRYDTIARINKDNIVLSIEHPDKGWEYVKDCASEKLEYQYYHFFRKKYYDSNSSISIGKKWIENNCIVNNTITHKTLHNMLLNAFRKLVIEMLEQKGSMLSSVIENNNKCSYDIINYRAKDCLLACAILSNEPFGRPFVQNIIGMAIKMNINHIIIAVNYDFIQNAYETINESNNNGYIKIQTFNDNKLIDIINKSNNLYTENSIRMLSPSDFEKFVAQVFTQNGYSTLVTDYSNDEGKDIEATKNGIKYFIECKHYSKDNSVDEDVISKLVGASIQKAVVNCIVVTTGYYTKKAILTSKDINKHGIVNIQLMDINDLLKMANTNKLLPHMENVEETYLEFIISYPKFYLSNVSVENKINNDIMEFINEGKQNFSSYSKGYIKYTVSYENDSIVSIIFTWYGHSKGMIHGHLRYQGKIYDKTTGACIYADRYIKLTNEDIDFEISKKLLSVNDSCKCNIDKKCIHNSYDYSKTLKNCFIGYDGNICLLFQPYSPAAFIYGATYIRFTKKEINYYNEKNHFNNDVEYNKYSFKDKESIKTVLKIYYNIALDITTDKNECVTIEGQLVTIKTSVLTHSICINNMKLFTNKDSTYIYVKKITLKNNFEKEFLWVQYGGAGVSDSVCHGFYLIGFENTNLKIYTSFDEIQRCGLICQSLELFIHKDSGELWIQGICRDRCVKNSQYKGHSAIKCADYKIHYAINAVTIIYDNINDTVKLNYKDMPLI